MYPSFPSLRMVSSGKVWASSHCMTCGRISASANSRTDLRSWICSGVYSKSTSDDFFGRGVPMHGAALAVAVDRHAAGDRNAEAHIERTIRLLAGANAVEEILHVRVRTGPSSSDHFVAFGAVDLLREVADLLSFGNRAIRAENIFGAAELVVAESRIPSEQDLFRMLHGHVHGVRHFAAILPQINAADHVHGFGNLQLHY